jgi:transposase
VVEIFHRGRRVASHVREYGRKRFITNPDHMPASHRAHLEWTPSKIVAWGASIGPSVAELIETILTTRPHPEHGYRACLGLMQLVKRYGRDRVSAACKRALEINGASYTSVNSILKHDLDRVPAGADAVPAPIPIHHANLRGPAYYQQNLLEA